MNQPNWPWGTVTHTVTTTETVPKPPPTQLHWHIGPVQARQHPSTSGSPGTPATGNENITMQLTADQQVALAVSATDAYGNEVELTGDVTWSSSDESTVTVTQDPSEPAQAIAAAVGPTGTAAVTVISDPDSDTGTPNFQGSLAIDVVAGDVTEVVISASDPTDKP